MQKKLIAWLVIVASAVLVYCALPGQSRERDVAKWNGPLNQTVTGADRLVVRKPPVTGTKTETVAKLRGVKQIREMLALIDVDAKGSGFHCMCDGEYWIHVYRGDREVAVLGYHHGRSLRWIHGSWNGDALLTPAAQKSLPAWFKQHGIDCFQDICDQQQARTKDRQETAERFAGYFPESARTLLIGHRAQPPTDGYAERVGQQIRTLVNDDTALAVAVCRALGSDDMSWSTTGGKERRALAAVKAVDGEAFHAALQQIEDERDALRGAARIFFREGFDEKVPAGQRSPWTLRLARVVFNDELDANKPYLIRKLSLTVDLAVKRLLKDVFLGKTGREIDLERAYAQEPGLRAGAALALAVMNDDSIKPDVRRMLAGSPAEEDRAALEVCLGLLGEPDCVQAEHFRLKSYSIGRAALKAVERDKGVHTMEALVKGGIHHPWARVRKEALATFAKLTGRTLSTGEIDDWWEVEHEGQRRPQPLLEIKGDTAQLRAVAFSPDGLVIAAGSNDSQAHVFDVQTGERIRSLAGHTFTVMDVAFHPQRSELATVSGDKTARIWDVETGKLLHTFTGHRHWVTCVAFTPDGRHLVTGSEDKTLRVWNLDTGQHELTFSDHRRPVEGLAMGPKKLVASVCRGRGGLLMWDWSTGEVVRTIPDDAAASSYTALVFSPDGRQIATAGYLAGEKAEHINLFASGTGKLKSALQGHTDTVSGVAFSPDGRILASTGHDKQIKIWDVATGKELVSFKGHPESINSIRFSTDGDRLATCSEDKTIRIWSVDGILKFFKSENRDF